MILCIDVAVVSSSESMLAALRLMSVDLPGDLILQLSTRLVHYSYSDIRGVANQ